MSGKSTLFGLYERPDGTFEEKPIQVNAAGELITSGAGGGGGASAADIGAEVDAVLKASPQPVSASTLPLPTGAATEATLASRLAEGTPITGEALEPGGTSTLGWLSSLRKKIADIYTVLTAGTINVSIPAGTRVTDGNNFAAVTGNAVSPAGSMPALVTTLSPNSPGGSAANPLFTGDSNGVPITTAALTAVGQDLVGNFDISAYGYLVLQLTGTFVGTITISQSDDGVTYSTVPDCWNETLQTRTSTIATTGQLILIPRVGRYLRLRSTAYSSGTIAAALVGVFGDFPVLGLLTENTFTTRIPTNGTKTAANSVPVTLSTDSSIQRALPVAIADVALAAITTTTTTAAFTPTFGISNEIVIAVTAVSGTTPAMDVTLQESADLGTTWTDVYTFPQITAVGVYRSGVMTSRSLRYRYVQTIGGTAPSFTRSITRLQSSIPVPNSGPFTRNGSVSTTVDLPIKGRIRRILANNRTAGVIFLQVHSKATPLVTGDVPLNGEIYPIPVNESVLLSAADLGDNGTYFGANTRLGLSTTFATYTAATPANTSIFAEAI